MAGRRRILLKTSEEIKAGHKGLACKSDKSASMMSKTGWALDLPRLCTKSKAPITEDLLAVLSYGKQLGT